MPEPDSSSFTMILFIFITLLIRASVVSTKSLITEFSESRMKKLSDDGNENAKRILLISYNSEKYIRGANCFLIFLDFVYVCLTQVSIVPLVASAFTYSGSDSTTVFVLTTIIVLFLLFLITLVFGYVLPHIKALHDTDSKILKKVSTISFYSRLFIPFAAFSTGVSSWLLKIFGAGPREGDSDDDTEEEILKMVDEGEEKGVIEGTAKDMIENIFDFHDTTADEIMTHRTDVIAIEDNESIEDAAQLSIKYGYSRIPVFHEDIDDIIGVVYVKDLLKYIGHSVEENLKITDVMRKAYFIPESKRCGELFTEMTEKRIQIAIIVDEYGGTEGIITMEDLLESIVGNIQDEYDNEEDEITKISENVFTVEGTAPIDEIADMLGTEFPEGEYDTVAGFVVELLGRIPSEDEHPSVKYDSFIFIVENIEDRRISRIKIIRKEKKKQEEQKNEEKEKDK